MKKGILYIISLLMMSVVWRCAHQVAPTGGPKDTTPPKILSESPPNGSTGFTGNRFSVKFDEFVELDGINKQLLISPPMMKMPSFHLKGKTLTVKFNEPLKPNTTYSVYFGSAIVDITERNPLANYSYIFSTGATIDSMSLTGTLVNAFDLKPVENAYVLLYKDNNDTLSLDSLPLFVKPFYVSKTDKAGKFSFRALADTSYLIFGLNDKNNSLTFDQPTEEIAFADTLIRPVYIAKSAPKDTAVQSTDSAAFSTDSLLAVTADSLPPAQETEPSTPMAGIKLRMFLNEDTVQRLLEAKAESFNKLRFVFALPASGVSVKPLDSLEYVTERSRYNDTVWWYLKEPHPDTLGLLFLNGKDTLERKKLSLIPKSRLLRKGKKEKDAKQRTPLKFNVVPGSNIKPGESLKIVFDQPVESFDNDSVLLISGSDSTYKPDYRFADSLHRVIVFPFSVVPGTTYKLIVPDSAVRDWNRYANQAVVASVRAKELKEYGTFTLKVKVPQKAGYVLQLLDDNENVKAQRFFGNDTVLRFDYLDPKKYKLKVIFDANGNGKWDTGNYLRKRQPEEVLYFPKEMDIKANWEYEEQWEIK